MNIEEAFKEYRDPMLRAMRSFSGDQEAAEDGVSHAFIQALVHRPMLEAMPEAAMKAWLYAAARNAVVDIKRKETRFRETRFQNIRSSWFSCLEKDGETGDVEIADPRLEDPAGKAVAEQLAAQLLANLPESPRIPVELKYYGDLNATEIGEAMKLPAATVRTRLRTAMLRLRAN